MQKQNSLLNRKRSKDKPLRKKSSKNIRIKGPWSAHEDQLLMKWIEVHGPKNWARCAETIKGRNGKQCREHWNNSLNYNILKGQWSTEEDLFIMVFYAKLDKSWKKMIPLFKSRTENAIKNRFFSQLRKITANYVKKDKSEYNSKFKLGTLLKYYNKGIEEAKNDFLKEHPMTEDNYNNFIKDVENLINNKPKEQKFIELDNIEKKYFLNLTNKDNNKDNKDDIDEGNKDDNNDININKKIENEKNEKEININVVKEIDIINIKNENDDKDNDKVNENKENQENKENNNDNNEQFDDDKDSISISDYENRKDEAEKNNNENNNRNDLRKNNEINKSENKGINTIINSTAFNQNIPINKNVSNNIQDLKRNLSIDINKINNMNNLIGQNTNITNNNFNNNFGCNNYYYNIYNNNNFISNNNTFNTIKENNNMSNINNIAYNNIVNNKIIINNDSLKQEQNYPLYTKKPSDLNDYLRNNSYKNYFLGRSPYELDTSTPFIRYNSNSMFDFNNNNSIYGANNMNNNYYNNIYRSMNSNTDFFNFDKPNYISKDSGLFNSNPFKRSDSTDIKNLNKLNYPFNTFGYKRSTSFGSNKDVKFFENINNDEISKQ